MGSGGGGDLASAGVEFYGADAERAGVEMQNKFNKEQAAFNTKLKDIERKEVMKAADKDIEQRNKEVKGLLGQQKVSLAAQGIDIESGTAAQIQDETRDLAVEEAQATKNNAWNKAWGLKLEAQQFEQQTRFDAMAAKRRADTSVVTAGLKAGVAAGKLAAGGG